MPLCGVSCANKGNRRASSLFGAMTIKRAAPQDTWIEKRVKSFASVRLRPHTTLLLKVSLPAANGTTKMKTVTRTM
eukprot:7382487-Prymnesium_polylepis.1